MRKDEISSHSRDVNAGSLYGGFSETQTESQVSDLTCLRSSISILCYSDSIEKNEKWEQHMLQQFNEF